MIRELWLWATGLLTRASLYYLLTGLCLLTLMLVLPNHYVYLALGLGVIAAAGIALLHYRYLWYLGVALMPFSINLERYFEGFSISAPSDLIALALLGLLLATAPRHGPPLNALLRHPLTQALGLYFLWMAFTSVGSTMPVVSVKFLANGLWYAGAFYLTSILLFTRPADCLGAWLAPIPALAFVALYTIINHAGYGFSFKASYFVMKPFYKEHTAYAASLGFYTAAYGALAFVERTRPRLRLIFGLTFAVLAVAIITSYTRGAWLGIAGAFAGYLAVRLWPRFRVWLLTAGAIAVPVALIFVWQADFSFKKPNEKRKGFGEHLSSAVNVESDLSNLERINRWVAAREMFLARPLLGFGPGTYAMQYAPYQQAQYRTIVSTNRGNVGTAHSEFLLAASEMGVIGLLLTGALYVISLLCAARGILYDPEEWRRGLYAAAFCGLASYYLHGFVNNFLDQDKIAIPVYVSLAAIVALDLFHNPRSRYWSSTQARG